MKNNERPSPFKAARNAADLTQAQAADLLNVPAWTLKGWEARGRAPALAVEMLLLKTGQFSVSSRKDEFRLRLAGGGVVAIKLPKGMRVGMR